MQKNTTGSKLKALREYAGYSPEKLAMFLDCEPEQVTAWENGEEEPAINQWMMMCRLYSVTPDEMFSHINAEELVNESVRDEFCHESAVNRLLQWGQYI